MLVRKCTGSPDRVTGSLLALALLGSPWLAGGCSPSGGSGGENPDATARPRGIFPAPLRQTVGAGFGTGLERADLDADGVADLVVGLEESFSGPNVSTLQVLYLDKLGLVRRTVDLPVRFARDIVADDWDGDGDQDLAVLDSIGEVLMFLQGPGGDFGTPLPYSVGLSPSGLTRGDFDGDGLPDLLTSNYSFSEEVSVLLGNGDGTFAPALCSTTDGYVPAGAAGDLDGDGDLDLVSLGPPPSLVAGLGDGTFAAPVPIPGAFAAERIAVAEVTGDGFLDLVEVSSGDLHVLAGDGAGGFTPGYSHVFGTPNYSGTPLVIADLTGDGEEDFATARSGHVVSFVSLGAGNFRASDPFAIGGYPYGLAAGDGDGDLVTDLFVLTSETDGLSFATSILVMLSGRGNGTFEGPCSYPTTSPGTFVRTADLVVDGVPDLALTTYYPQDLLEVLPGLGDGSFGAPVDTALVTDPRAIAVLDADGNTLEDVLVAEGDSYYSNGTLSFFSSAGDGTFDPPVSMPAGGAAPAGIAGADLDGDLLLDLVVVNSSSNQIAVHLGVLGGGFADPLRFGTGLYPSSLALADVDGDAFLDVLAANRLDSTVSVLLGRGDGTFLPDTTEPTLPGPAELAAGDVDGDGRVDLAVACGGDFETEEGGVQVFLGLGNGDFAAPQTLSTQLAYHVALADLDRDGRSDVVWAEFQRFHLALSRGAGFAEPEEYVIDSLNDLALEDLDGDGRIDVVLVGGYTFGQGTATVFLNQSP